MFNLAECAMTMKNVDKNDMYINNVTANTTDTMSFLGILSPAASSVDSTDIKMDNTSLSPMNAEFSSVVHMLEDFETDLDKPYLRIIEQPVEKFRFRYKSEMAGTHGSLIGMSSDKIRKNTYPAVQLDNYDGRAFIRCSIYQIKDDEPHAHRLVMKADHGEKDDPHDIEVSPERGYIATYKSMGIIHTAKKYLSNELYKKLYRLQLERLNRDGINKNLTQLEDAEIKKKADALSKTINLNTVRLKFEAYREVVLNGQRFSQLLCPPVYSHGINNLKSALTGELKIVRLDHTTASCVGGQEIFILVEKVTKNNIQVRFFECDEDDNEIWEDYGKFSHNDVHHQYAIVFKAPPYKDVNIENPVDVCMQLVRPSDGARSEARTFKYKPSEKIGRKRVRYCESLTSGELPATINTLSIGSVCSVSDSMINSLDPQFFNNVANIESFEFDEIFRCAAPDLQDFSANLATDGCASTSSDSQNVQTDDLYSKICKKVVADLSALVKRKPPPERVESVVEKLFKHFRAPDGNNPLHCAILSDQSQHLRYMLLLLTKLKHLKVLDVQNDKRQTALHVAIIVNDPIIIKLLLSVGVDPNITDENGDTPLNLAVKSNLNLNDYIPLIEVTDLEKDNYDGFTPLYSAVQNGNLNSVKLLVKKNADVNHKIPSSGNTVLHLAIEEKNKEIVNFLLEETTARLDVENHSKVTPGHLAKLLLTEGSESEKIFNIITDYLGSRGFESLIIKDEPEYDSSSEEEYNMEIKLEPNTSEPMETSEIDENALSILKNAQFSKECIGQLGKILDDTDILKKLSKDLNFEEIQNSLLTLTTSQLLNYAYVTGVSVFVVRDLLKSYGLNEAVLVIDNLYIKK